MAVTKAYMYVRLFLEIKTGRPRRCLSCSKNVCVPSSRNFRSSASLFGLSKLCGLPFRPIATRVERLGPLGPLGPLGSESQSLRANVIMNEEALLGLKGVLTSRGLQGGSSRLSLDKRVPMFPQNKLEHFINNEKF